MLYRMINVILFDLNSYVCVCGFYLICINCLFLFQNNTLEIIGLTLENLNLDGTIFYGSHLILNNSVFKNLRPLEIEFSLIKCPLDNSYGNSCIHEINNIVISECFIVCGICEEEGKQFDLSITNLSLESNTIDDAFIIIASGSLVCTGMNKKKHTIIGKEFLFKKQMFLSKIDFSFRNLFKFNFNDTEISSLP